MKEKVYVLFYKSKDGKEYGIEGAYEEEYKANEACELLEKYDSTRDWYVDVYEVK